MQGLDTTDRCVEYTGILSKGDCSLSIGYDFTVWQPGIAEVTGLVEIRFGLDYIDKETIWKQQLQE